MSTAIPLESPVVDRGRALLRDAVAHAAHLLPSQPPIKTFVHHNTLHAFQHLPFEEAVLSAAARFGTQPYESEEAFGRYIACGRITHEDIAAVLASEAVSDAPVMASGPSIRELRAARLAHAFELPDGEPLSWLLEEGDALSCFHPASSAAARARTMASGARALGAEATTQGVLSTLYQRLSPHAPTQPVTPVGPRPRDRVLATTGEDVDRWIHPLLIRVCGAFVDQGVAYWQMPYRQQGLLRAFRCLYGRSLAPPDPWLQGLPQILAAQERDHYDAERTAVEALKSLGAPEDQWSAVIEASLRSLPGWAGMIAQLQDRPDRAPVESPPAQLMDYVALSLLLEAQAVQYLQKSHAGVLASEPAASDAQPPRASGVVYEAFILAQVMGLGPEAFRGSREARAFVQEVASFDSFERRRLWHLAYERHHRQRVLDGLLAHGRLGVPPRTAPEVQAIFCIDEREESLRRHLEEIDGTVETLGFAGFFGVAMAYRGVSDVRATPLCPVVVRPRHLVVEEPADARGEASGKRLRAAGTIQHAAFVGANTAMRGGLVAATVGPLSVLPLVGRCLFPRMTERLSHALQHAAVGEVTTRLRVERSPDDDAPDGDGLLHGFTVAEMADIVANLIRTCGLSARLAKLVVVVGHGSSSLNNPHESAHDCGATGGGRGGPNARAFAIMANHKGVRSKLAAEGLSLAGTHFVGAYHNTCDDAVLWFDLDLVPDEFRDELARVQASFERARRLDAHERCRRFESAPHTLTLEQALAHVEGRAVDLGEPRPEYGHATNAVCIVGRRERTRGLFLDRRAFLVSYDPLADPKGAILGSLLSAVGPVGAGISLEYYFSFVDPTGYGCGTKLPHNITGLLGVMNGHASDLRTGLPWQMVEIHEPVRLLTIVEAEPEVLEQILESNAGVRELVVNRWIQLAAWSPTTDKMWFFSRQGFVLHEPETNDLPTMPTSTDYYRGQRGHLGCARIEAALSAERSA